MPGPAPGKEVLAYVISFDLPGGIQPITRVGELVIFPDGSGCLTTIDERGRPAPHRMSLNRDEVRVCRRVFAFWMGAPKARRFAVVL